MFYEIEWKNELILTRWLGKDWFVKHSIHEFCVKEFVTKWISQVICDKTIKSSNVWQNMMKSYCHTIYDKWKSRCFLTNYVRSMTPRWISRSKKLNLELILLIFLLFLQNLLFTDESDEAELKVVDFGLLLWLLLNWLLLNLLDL